ncbi:MAG: DivIVA domain-containing protein [Lactobacillus sp.]|nr:DivIVA domain-containing protein [Lactobacillus sp.]
MEKSEDKKKLTPMDIHDKEFKHRGAKGYDAYDVDLFLDRIIDDYADTLDENVDLRNRIVELESQQEQVEKERQAIIDRANEQAQSIVNNASSEENSELENRFNVLKSEYLKLKADLQAISNRPDPDVLLDKTVRDALNSINTENKPDKNLEIVFPDNYRDHD